MRRPFRAYVRCALRAGLLLTGLLGALATAPAQDDPFGAPAAGAKPAPIAPGQRAKPAEPVETDPVVLTLRETNPKTADELTRAASVMLNYGRADESKRYLAKLAALKPDDDAWAKLHAKFGSETFLRWTSDKDLQPEGAALGRAALTAAKKLAEDADRLKQLAAMIADPSPAKRREAQLGLLDAGAAALSPLLMVLADAARTEEHGAAAALLIKLGPQTIEPLIGILESEDEALRARVFDVLAGLQARRATPYLLRAALAEPGDEVSRTAALAALQRIVGDVPSRHQAELYLAKRIRAHLAGDPPVRIDHDNTGELWHWDAGRKTSVARRYLAHDLYVVEATRLARELYRLAPESIEHRRLYLMTRLEAEKIVAGADQPLPRGEGTAASELAKLGPEALEDTLAYAMKQNRPLAAVAAAEVLGDIGTEELVMNVGGKTRPLAAALAHNDRRLRYAAVEAVLKIDPKQPFAGASYVADALGYFSGSVGSRRVLVAHPRAEDSQTLVGLLRSLGFEADHAQTGRGAFLRGIKSPDYEYILLSDRLDKPPTRELINTLRQDPRTAGLPIGILTELTRDEESEAPSRTATYRNATRLPGDPLARAEQIADGDARTVAVPRPYDGEGMSFIVQRLEAKIGRGAVTRDERVRQASGALDWLAKLAESEQRYSFYEVARQQPSVESSLQTPELAARSAHVLGLLGTPRAQIVLVDAASQIGRPVADRDAAVQGLRLAIKRRGLLLTRDEILRQYDRYNKSETLDPETQRVLGDVLDSIEAPSRPPANPAGPPTSNPPNPPSNPASGRR